MTQTDTIVIIGAGPAGRAAREILPDARIIARPEATAWHAESGRIWVESAAGVQAVGFGRLLVCADEPLLLLALGCVFTGGRPNVDAAGATSIPGVYVAGRVLGAVTPEEAASQGRIAASALAGQPAGGRIEAKPLAILTTQRMDPLEIAQVLETPPGPERNRAALAQFGARGNRLRDLIAPARPVGFAALAALAPARLEERAPQSDSSSLQEGFAS